MAPGRPHGSWRSRGAGHPGRCRPGDRLGAPGRLGRLGGSRSATATGIVSRPKSGGKGLAGAAPGGRSVGTAPAGRGPGPEDPPRCGGGRAGGRLRYRLVEVRPVPPPTSTISTQRPLPFIGRPPWLQNFTSAPGRCFSPSSAPEPPRSNVYRSNDDVDCRPPRMPPEPRGRRLPHLGSLRMSRVRPRRLSWWAVSAG